MKKECITYIIFMLFIMFLPTLCFADNPIIQTKFTTDPAQWEQDPYLNGEVGDFFAYNRAISASEVADLAGSGDTPTPTPETETPTPTPISGSLGDVNGDGAVDIVDALLVAQYYVGLINSFC